MGTYFSDTNLQGHIDQHRRPEPREFSIKVNVGDQTAAFSKFAHVAEHGLLVYRRAYLIQPTDLAASSTANWKFEIVQHDDAGRAIPLGEFDGAKRGMSANVAARVPSTGNLNTPLGRELPLFITGTKTGAPAATDDLVVQIVLSLR